MTGMDQVSCELDAAYTRNVTERFDGLTHPPDHDGAETLVDVSGEDGRNDDPYPYVDLTIPDAGIRLNLEPEQAEALGCLLIAHAARTRGDAPWSPAPLLADACPFCHPGDHPAVLPFLVIYAGTSLRALYRHQVCGTIWPCSWDADATGWPRAEAA
jgi:hypothetical protein